MKMCSSEMDAETDKWQEGAAGGAAIDHNNDIVKRAKNMSSMAFSMYQFTRGEGALKTTQDLFTQAEYFAEEANRLYKVVRLFSYQVNQMEQNLTFRQIPHYLFWDKINNNILIFIIKLEKYFFINLFKIIWGRIHLIEISF